MVGMSSLIVGVALSDLEYRGKNVIICIDIMIVGISLLIVSVALVALEYKHKWLY